MAEYFKLQTGDGRLGVIIIEISEMAKYVMILLSAIVIAVIGGVWINIGRTQRINTDYVYTTATPVQKVTKNSNVVEPIAGFKERITKKFFGTYITPANSPIKPEIFTGYHTGVDVEFEEVTIDVPVYAISDGTIVVSRYASGYGGVLVIQHQIDGETLYGIYGHLRQSSMKRERENVFKGEQIAILGTGYSKETDGERKHLHFGLSTTNSMKGYVTNIEELNRSWMDPMLFYKNED